MNTRLNVSEKEEFKNRQKEYENIQKQIKIKEKEVQKLRTKLYKI